MPEDQNSKNTRRNGDDDEPSGRIWQGLKSLLRLDNREQSLREQLEDVIDDYEEEGDTELLSDPAAGLHAAERKLLRNMLHFSENTADDVSVPRADIIALAHDASFEECVALFAEHGHSRFPVYKEDLDHIVGMIHIKDVFKTLASNRRKPRGIRTFLRQPLFVPVTMGVLALLDEMQKKRVHMAIVFDEYDGTEGIVTIEDLVEEIVGEIEDEHDDAPEQMIVASGPGIWDIDARTELDDLDEELNTDFCAIEEDVDTLGGLSFILAEHVPQVGETMTADNGWRLEILEADEKRVTRIRLHRADEEAEAEEAG